MSHTFGKVGFTYLGLVTLGNVTFQLRILFCIGKQSSAAEHNSVSVNLVFLTIEYADFLNLKIQISIMNGNGKKKTCFKNLNNIFTYLGINKNK